MRFSEPLQRSAVKGFGHLRGRREGNCHRLASRRGELARRPRQPGWQSAGNFPRLETVPQQPKRATIRDVAEATGLSPAAVSYALRGIQTSEETQERVRRAAAELGYKVDRIARALASGRTGTVGLLC